MAFSHGSVAQFFVDGFNATSFVNEVSHSASIDAAETTVLGNTAKQYVPGLEDATVKTSGFWDATGSAATDTLSFDYKVQSIVRQFVPVLYIPQTDAQGSICYFSQMMLTSHNRGTNVSDAASSDLEFQGETGFNRGVNLSNLSTVSTSSNTTAIDDAASSANGANAILTVTAASGTTPTLVAKVQHSVDNSVWVDLITFGSKNSRSSEFQTVAGTVQRYVRVLWTVGGTTPSFTFHVGFHRGTL